MSTQKDNASMRYFLASLKPFGRPLFWAPLALVSLALMFYWQYSQRPALLQTRTNDDQPRQNLDQAVNGAPDMTKLPLNDLVSTDLNDLQAQQAAKTNQTVSQKPDQLDPNQVWRFNQADKNAQKRTTNSNSLFTPLVQNNQSVSNSGSSLFVPLMPQIKQNSQTPTRTALQPIQVTPPSVTTRQSALQSAMGNVPVNRYNNPRYNNGVNAATPDTYSRGGAPNTGYQQGYGQNRSYQSNSPYSNPYNQNPVYSNSPYNNQPTQNGYQGGAQNNYQGGYQSPNSQPDPAQYGGQYNNTTPRYGVQPSAMEPNGRY
ncbi:MAG: hypothetical protein N5P05_001701 [Chroococcopsis gigantea SAG 12.99]|jgi:hypothetical protein|nr:hypothetical protein [Chlorogloea purpurea SAG 13.99]MDV3000095.1 hypothetical protein [Chroococcopsis gigantea SAG 12.99]